MKKPASAAKKQVAPKKNSQSSAQSMNQVGAPQAFKKAKGTKNK